MRHSCDSAAFYLNDVMVMHEYRESDLNFALSSSYLPATFLCSGFVRRADLPLLPLEVVQLPLGVLQLLSSLHSFTLQGCDLMAILPVQGLRILT